MNEASIATGRWNRPKPAATWSPSGVALIGGILLVIALAAAVSVDVVRSNGGVKGDEATYVGMALSLAYDGDLAYQRRDLERFWGIYHQGPSGVFLKRGMRIRLRMDGAPPFVHLDNSEPDRRPDRLYFGKAMIYSVVVAPFVRLLGVNGFLVFHVLLLAGVLACGYLFAAARSQPGPALAFTLAFVGASVVPVYAVFLTSDLFNFALVFFAYFCWAYKEVATPRFRLLSGPASDYLAAVLLAIATYSKVSNAPLMLPLVLLQWWRGELRRGLVIGAVSVVAAGLLFTANAAVTGEFNYQGGTDRRQFNSDRGYPFDSPEGTWENRPSLGDVGTNDAGAQDSLKPSEIVRLLPINIKYFLVGRHFGFVPYFFPGVVAILAWLFSRYRFERWRALTFVALVLGTLVLLIWLPYTWSGGGGPPGNRYFMNVYPLAFFLMPPLTSAVPALLAWTVGALFTAKMLVNPFGSASRPWETVERGWARRLPVELTMALDLPLRLAQPIRGRILYGHDPFVQLYFLDQNAWPPEPEGMWVSGSGRADVIVRSVDALDHLSVTANARVRTTLIVSAGSAEKTIPIEPGTPATFDLPVFGVRGFRSHAYLLSARSTEGFVPRLHDPGSKDDRNLGVQISFQAVNAPAGK